MSMSGAEKAGVAGAILLGAGLVAAAVLLLMPGGGLGRRGKPEPEPEEPVVETVVPPSIPDAPLAGTDPERPRSEPETELDLRKEITRLKRVLAERDERIAGLEAKLTEAGIPLVEKEADPAEVAAGALAELRACGLETSPTDIDVLVEKLRFTGKAGVETVRRFLEQGQDARFADTWQFIAGRFTAYPTLRIALLDTLRLIGGVEGQAALVGLLRVSTDPLETLFLISTLAGIDNVTTVEEVRVAAARQYTEGKPAKRELLFRTVLLEILADQSADLAVRDLEAFATRPEAPDESAEAALGRIAAIDAPAALDALARVAAARSGGPLARRAAEILVGNLGAGALSRLQDGLATMAPDVRQTVYRSIVAPLEEDLKRLRRIGAKGGLEVVEGLNRLSAARAARAALLEGRKNAEDDSDARRALDPARRALADLADRIDEFRTELGGK